MARYDGGYGPRGGFGPRGGGWDGYDADYDDPGARGGYPGAAPGGFGWGPRNHYGGRGGYGSGLASGTGGYPGAFFGAPRGGRDYQPDEAGEYQPGGYWYSRGRSRAPWQGGARERWGGGYDAYDRGVYGEAYPGPASRGGRGTYGGDHPFDAGRSAGRPWGARGYDRGYGRGYDGGWGGGGEFARTPFIPEEAYQRHPEYDQPPRNRRWEAYHHGDDDLGDRDVHDAVRRRMAADAWLDPDRIQVRVDDGVVTLTGEVDDFLEARYAWDDAWEAPGVRGVVNNLTVRTDLPGDSHGDVVAQSSGERPEVDAGGGTLAREGEDES